MFKKAAFMTISLQSHQLKFVMQITYIGFSNE